MANPNEFSIFINHLWISLLKNMSKYLNELIENTEYNCVYTPDNFCELQHIFNNNLKPGDIIRLKSNTTYYGNLEIDNIHGNQDNYIQILGDNTSIINGNNIDYGRAITINNSSYVYFGLNPTNINSYGEGFILTNSQKGLYINNCNNITAQNLCINNIGDEGLHVMNNSFSCKILNNEIYNTGNYNKGFGEGIYCGSAVSNWIDGKADKTNNIIVSYNNVYNTTAECIDIKEGSYNGTVNNNIFNGSKLNNDNSADSWIDIKGENWIIKNNEMNITLQDGIQTHFIENSVPNLGCNNKISGNIMNCLNVKGDPCPGYAINISNKTTGNTVSSDNIYNNTANNGLTNIDLTVI